MVHLLGSWPAQGYRNVGFITFSRWSDDFCHSNARYSKPRSIILGI